MNPRQSEKKMKVNRQSHPLTNKEFMDSPIRIGLSGNFLVPFLLVPIEGVPVPVILINAAGTGE